MNNEHYKNLQTECDYYRRAFRDLNKAAAEFLACPGSQEAFDNLERVQREICGRDE